MKQERLFVPITFPLPFEVGSMNVYLFLGEPLTLLDAGPKTEAARQEIEKTLQAHGFRCEDLKRIIISHGHVDHFGLARELAEKSGAEVYIHPYDVPKIRTGYDFFQEHLPLLREAGVPEESLPELKAWSAHADKLKDQLDDFQLLEDNEEIPFDSFSLKVIHCPGHSQGHICLYHEGRGELFAGDHILSNITPNPAMEPSLEAPEKRNQALVQYLDSLKKIERLNVERIFPAHGPVIPSPRERIAEIYEHHLQRKERLLSLLNRQGLTAHELGTKLFGRAKGMDIFLIVSEVLAHLDILLQEEKARTQERNGVIRFFAA